jgi:hypothetical protein
LAGSGSLLRSLRQQLGLSCHPAGQSLDQGLLLGLEKSCPLLAVALAGRAEVAERQSIVVREVRIMKRFVGLAVALTLIFALSSTAHAQVYGGQSYSYNPWTGAGVGYSAGYNPWTGSYYGATTGYNPWTGGYSGSSAGYNPWLGAYYQGNTFGNPYYGLYGSSGGFYNPWTGVYGYGYRAW